MKAGMLSSMGHRELDMTGRLNNGSFTVASLRQDVDKCSGA